LQKVEIPDKLKPNSNLKLAASYLQDHTDLKRLQTQVRHEVMWEVIFSTLTFTGDNGLRKSQMTSKAKYQHQQNQSNVMSFLTECHSHF